MRAIGPQSETRGEEKKIRKIKRSRRGLVENQQKPLLIF